MSHHAHRDGASGKPHLLVEHLRDVACLARRFGEAAAGENSRVAKLAEWAGWLHDLGKYRQEFQEYLYGRRQKSVETQHAIFGAARALKDRLTASGAAVYGHHAGLKNLGDIGPELKTSTLEPLKQADELKLILEQDLRAIGAALPQEMPPGISGKLGSIASADEFAIRMAFSCLVDADYLDTELYMSGQPRSPIAFDGQALLDRVRTHVEKIQKPGTSSELLRVRREIYESCLKAAELPPGFFTLTTPTGGGKTLSGLAFALKHAVEHGLRRVILVIPYLSIIEQNAAVYRDVLGEDAVIEHHSAIPEPPRRDGLEDRRRGMAELASENWDGPVIVTTSVQFLDSLFANRPAKCRKLHNIARSVVVLDEVQTLPHHFLEPILNVFRDLNRDYGTSFVFCSATQPGFAQSSQLKQGFRDGEVREIAPQPKRVFSTLGRVRYRLPCVEESWSWDRLVEEVRAHPQVLTIVNLRRHAIELYQRLWSALPDAERQGLFHLSSSMCPEHRRAVLGKKDAPESGSIYEVLKRGAPCRVVSTQVVEAGVDIDFPVVFRALGPLDAIIQAAGRCNREGKIAEGGQVAVFRLDDPQAAPPGIYQTATRLSYGKLETIAADPNQLAMDPDLFADFHRALVNCSPPDAAKRNASGQKELAIQEMRARCQFRDVAEAFRTIEDGGHPIAVPYGKGKGLIETLRSKLQNAKSSPSKGLHRDIRALQGYFVSVRDNALEELRPHLTPLDSEESMFALKPELYHEKLGILIGERPPEEFLQ